MCPCQNIFRKLDSVYGLVRRIRNGFCYDFFLICPDATVQRTNRDIDGDAFDERACGEHSPLRAASCCFNYRLPNIRDRPYEYRSTYP